MTAGRAGARVRAESGQSGVLLTLLLASLLLVFLGFAVDLGRLYLIRGEVNAAADAMALAAAQELIGTSGAGGLAEAAAARVQNDATGGDNRFNFGSISIGSDSTLASAVEGVDLYSSYADALGGDAGATVDGSAARYVRVRVRASGPLTFWQFLPAGQAGVTPVAASAVAGISQPVCSACGIEPFAVIPVDATNETDFGFVRGLKYTFYSQCTGVPPQALAGTFGLTQYTLLNRNLENSDDLDQQVFQLTAGGIPAPQVPVSDTSNLACPAIGAADSRLPAVSVAACNAANRGSIVTDTLCGLNARINPVPHPFCQNITDVDAVIQSYPPDIDVENHDDYLEYTGNRRRILTVAIVDNIPFQIDAAMNVLGFRQFLLEPNPGLPELNPTDPVGRFVALYIGFPAPLKQGRFGACGVTQGPGKVVLHQ